MHPAEKQLLKLALLGF